MPDDIIFTPDETDLAPAVRQRVIEYTDALGELHQRFIDNFEDALTLVTTTLTLGSEDRAAAGLLQDSSRSAVGIASQFLLTKVTKTAPGIGLFLKFWQALGPSDQAVSTSADAASWLHRLTAQLNSWRTSYDREQAAIIIEEITLNLLESTDREGAFDELLSATQSVRQASNTGPDVHSLEISLYESWINTNFTGFTEDGFGVIDYRFEAQSDGANLVSCTLQVGHGAKLAKRLNLLVGVSDGFSRIADLKVRKRIAICAKAIAGGEKWHFGWVDGNNQIEHSPMHDSALGLFEEQSWLRNGRLFEAENSFLDNPTSCADIGIHAHAN